MTNKEILEKAIQKAIDGGWEPLHEGRNPIDKSLVTVDHIIQEDPRHYIYSHDFAKALWGVSEHTALPGIDSYGEEDCEHCEANIWDSIPHYCWQYHLQQMVIADDPIKYLGENI